MTRMISIPEQFLDLLRDPHVGSLATVRMDGAPTMSPMWFAWDGQLLRFTHTTRRAKLAELQQEPRLSLLVIDPADGYRYLQVRAAVREVNPDPTGAFYVELARRYGRPPIPPSDSPDRVVIVAEPIGVSYSSRG
jgi:PPOX class probable F420-dependent enzyme